MDKKLLQNVLSIPTAYGEESLIKQYIINFCF